MRNRILTPDHGQHLGFPTREGEAYKARYTHADLDRMAEEVNTHVHPLPRAIGAHLHTEDYDIAVENGNLAWATGMDTEHDSGDGVPSTDRLTIPKGFAGVWDVELHVSAETLDWPYPESWGAILFHKSSAGATKGQFPAGTLTSYTAVQNVGSHIYCEEEDYFQALIEWYDGVGGAVPDRNFQVSCLSGYFIGT